MAGFLYFLPGEKGAGITEQCLRKFGLAHIREPDDTLHCREVINCRFGAGALVVNKRNFDLAVKFSEEIRWWPMPKTASTDGPQAQVGILGDQMPGPDDLARRKLIPGKLLRDEEGRAWMIPIARQASGVCNLPTVYDLDENGHLRPTKVRRRFERVWQHALGYLEAMYAAYQEAEDKDAPLRWTIPDAEALVVDAFECNYRVGARELTILEVLSDDLAQPIAEILTDADGYELLKKS